MEIDYRTVKALSSPTRVKILNKVLDTESTPTQLSDELGKSKSTVSSHLSTLHEADLIEKDSEEGRRRVTYTPTRKAEAIIKGRERKVRFSFGSSAISALAGLSIGAYALMPRFGGQSYASADTAAESEQLSAMTADAGAEAARTASESSSAFDLSSIAFSTEALLILGLSFLGFAALSFAYGWTVNRLDE